VTATDSSPAPGGPYADTHSYVIDVAPAWAAPAITESPADVSVAPGTGVTLHAAATGNPVPTVQWQVLTGTGWSDVPGATDRTLALSGVTATHRYRAVFTGYGDATATTSAATVTVVVPPVVTPPVVTGIPHARTVRAGKTATFTATASGTPAPTVRWQVRIKGHWKTIKGATRTSLVLKKVKRGWDRRAYRAVFTNAAGSVTTRAAVLKVRAARR
jgi:endoglucanase